MQVEVDIWRWPIFLFLKALVLIILMWYVFIILHYYLSLFIVVVNIVNHYFNYYLDKTNATASCVPHCQCGFDSTFN